MDTLIVEIRFVSVKKIVMILFSMLATGHITLRKVNGFILLEALVAMSLMISCLILLYQMVIQIHISYQRIKENEINLFSTWQE